MKKQTILSELQKTVAHNHKICASRQECLRVDLQSLHQLQEKYRDSYDVQGFFQDITQELKRSADADVAVTELDVYKSMPDSVKQQYLQGIRMNDPQQAVRSLTAKHDRDASSENSPPANSKIKFNVEDLKIYLLQQIEENHEDCGSRDSCLQSDLKIAAEIAQNLNDTDPGISEFTQLVPTMKRNAFKQPFDTEKFYNLYHDALVHQYSMLYKSSDRIKWTDLVKNIDTIHTRDPQITNAEKVQEKAKISKPILERLVKTLEEGLPARSLNLDADEIEAISDIHLITMKKMLYVCNVDEASVVKGNKYVDMVKDYVANENAEVLIISAAIESEIGATTTTAVVAKYKADVEKKVILL
jgi:hypothetical protein